MKWRITLVLMFLALTKIIASPQVPDLLIYKNDTIPIYNLLVEKYLQTHKDDQGRLFDLSFRNSIEGTSEKSFNCWRGYQAIYEIENDSLFVNSIIKCHSLGSENHIPKNYIKKLFGNKVKKGKVFIDWFSGEISFPLKENTNKILRWDGVFEKVYLHEVLIVLKRGKIIELRNVRNYTDLENGINRIQKDSIRYILFKHIKTHKWTKLNKFDCGEKYTVFIGVNGKIKDVIMSDYQTDEEIKEFWSSKREYNFCVKSVKKALSKLQFDILKRRGKPIEERIDIEFFINIDGTVENWTD